MKRVFLAFRAVVIDLIHVAYVIADLKDPDKATLRASKLPRCHRPLHLFMTDKD